MMRKPNFTSWLSSDESQIAFINWLLEWINYPENKSLNKTAKYLFNNFTENKIHSISYFNVLLSSDRKETIFIINKTHTLLITTGDVSLLDLNNILKKTSNGYPESKIIPIYVNTKHRVDFESISKLGYKLFLHNDMLKVLEYGISLGTKNDIFLDYFTIIKNQYESNQSYNKYPVTNWISCAYTGFYSKLQEELGYGNWDYFEEEYYNAFFLPERKVKFLNYEFKYYLQLEYNELRIKLNIIDEDYIDKKVYYFTYLSNVITDLFSIELNTDIRSDCAITIATYNEEYIITKENGFIDLIKTIENIKRIETYVEEYFTEAKTIKNKNHYENH